MSTPSFFLSSTIHDFKDLRSSIKFYLEEQGCAVLASEFNDFPKPLDIHSYHACIETLKRADYFLLLVGSRVGGWFDQPNRISITQQEYREAYELQKKNLIKIIIFVRSDVWQFREQRNELARFLEHSGTDPAIIRTVTTAPSKFASDAEFICDFIGEICRNAETKKAINHHGDFPAGNWVHTFNTFRDVIDAIRTQTFSGTSVDILALKKLLARELHEILKTSLVKFDEQLVCSPLNSVRLFHSHHTLTVETRDSPETEVITDRWDSISTFSIHILAMKLHTQILDRAIESSAFLKFSNELNAFVEEPVYEAIYKLKQEIQIFKQANTTEILNIVFEHTPNQRRGKPQTIRVNTLKLLSLLHTLDRWVNIIQLTKAILKYLNGADFAMPYLRTQPLISGMEDRLAKERVTDGDILKFLSEPP